MPSTTLSVLCVSFACKSILGGQAVDCNSGSHCKEAEARLGNSLLQRSQIEGRSVAGNCSVPAPEERFVEDWLAAEYDPDDIVSYVRSRSDIPTFNLTNGSKVELFFIESVVGGAWQTGGSSDPSRLQTSVNENIFEKYHSGIEGRYTASDGTKSKFVLSVWNNGPYPEGLAHCVDDYGPHWQYNTVVLFTRGKNEGFWYGDKREGVHFATLDGNKIDEVMDYVWEVWANGDHRKHYTVVSVWKQWDEPDSGRHNNFQLTCDDFSEELIWKVAELGAKFESPMPVLKRNYDALVTDHPLEKVDKHDERLKPFYDAVRDGGFMFYIKKMILSKILPCSMRMDWFIHNQTSDEYYLVKCPKLRAIYYPMPLPPTGTA